MIEVGEYVRTKDGSIVKIIDEIDEDYGERGNILYFLDKEVYDDSEGFEEYSFYALPDQFVKHSKNIIDLIEVGDYVNGIKVLNIMNGFAEGTMEIELSTHRKIYRQHIEEIKSIVTKEQFKNIEYIVED